MISGLIPVYMPGGRTPLHFSILGGSNECLSILLKYGSNKYEKDFDGNTAYDLALIEKRANLAAELKGVDVTQIQLPSENEITVKREYNHFLVSRRVKANADRKKIQDKAFIMSSYTPLHANIFVLNYQYIDSALAEALSIGTDEALKSILKEEIPGVYSFKMFVPEFCKLLLEEVDHYEKSGLPLSRPNSMNNYGIIFDDIGFEPMMDIIVKDFITPFAKSLFKNWGGETLDSHHAFMVKYKLGEDISLDTHVDDSEVTLNVCLGKEFIDGKLYFHGIRDTPNEHTDYFEFQHKLGVAIIHIGKHVHGASKITGGERCNLIIWCRSSVFRSKSSQINQTIQNSFVSTTSK